VVKAKKSTRATKLATYLGITIDTEALTLSIPDDKRVECHAMVQQLLKEPSIGDTQLARLLGKLSHLCVVLRPGRAFLGRLFDELRRARERGGQPIRLNHSARKDLVWWNTYLPKWCSTSMMVHSSKSASTEDYVYTDAADGRDSKGRPVGLQSCGGYWRDQFFAYDFTEEEKQRHITWKEARAVTLACATWGHLWHGKTIRLHIDAKSVTDGLGRLATPSHALREEYREMAMMAAKMNFRAEVVWIPGEANVIADQRVSRVPQLTLMSPTHVDMSFLEIWYTLKCSLMQFHESTGKNYYSWLPI
jgi:hypothetical protein